MRDKRGKFLELGTKRVNKAIEQLRLIGNLSNRSAYDYTDEDIKKIVRALQKEVDGLKSRFGDPSSAEDKFAL